MMWSRHAPRRPRVRAFLLVRPAWMYTCGCKLRCELAAASQVPARHCQSAWCARLEPALPPGSRPHRCPQTRELRIRLSSPILAKIRGQCAPLRGSIASQQLFGLRDRWSAVHAAHSPAGCTRLPEGYQAVGNFPKPCPEHRGLEDARVVVRACGRV